MRRNALDPSNIEAWLDLKADYNAARASKYRRVRRGIRTQGSSADWHVRNDADYLRMMEYSRDMSRNDAIVKQTVDRAVFNIIQEGIRYDPDTGSEQLNEHLKGRWIEWTLDREQVEIQKEFTFMDLEYLVMHGLFVDGDIVIIARDDGFLQLIEAHRIRSPVRTTRNVVHGFLLDDKRQRKECWITKEDVALHQTVPRVADIIRVPMFSADGQRQVFHIVDPSRASQTRGITALAPIIDVAAQFEDVQFAKMLQQQIVSCLGVVHEYDSTYTGDRAPAFGDTTTETLPSSGMPRVVEGISPGQHYFGEVGEKIKSFDPAVPNPEYFRHIKMMLQLIGNNLGVPYVQMMMDASETNFSGWRGAINEAQLGYRRKQRWLIQKMHRPIVRWKINQWIADGDSMIARFVRRKNAKPPGKDDVDLYRHKWNPPRWPYVQPREDATADLLRVRNALISPRRRAAEAGLDWEDLTTEIVEDNSMAIIKAKQVAEAINKRFKDDPVHWREIIALPTPDGVQLNLVDEPPVDQMAQAEGGGRQGKLRPGEDSMTRKKSKPNGKPKSLWFDD